MMTATRTRQITIACVALAMSAGAAPVLATDAYINQIGVTTTYGDKYISAAEITAGTSDMFNFGFGSSLVNVDLGAYYYDTNGITLGMLVDEINLEWQASIDPGQSVATAHFYNAWSQWRLLVTNPFGDGSAFSLDNTNAIPWLASLDSWDDFSPTDPPVPHYTVAQLANRTSSTRDGVDYISGGEITYATQDKIDFKFGVAGDQVTVRLRGYASTGISLDLLVGEINTAWQGMAWHSYELVASAYHDESTGLWQLMLADPTGDGSDFFAIDGGSAITAFDANDDYTPMAIPEPITLSLLALGGGMLLKRRRK